MRLTGKVSLLFFFLFLTQNYSQLKKGEFYNYYPPQYYRININNISTIFHSDGRTDIDGDGAFWYPKNFFHTRNGRVYRTSAVYESGFVFAGKIGDRINIGGSTYPSGLIPGKIGENPDDAKMYRVRRDWRKSGFENEILDEEGAYEEIYERYKNDWYNWPWEDGAPFEDIDNDGIYNPEIDIPGIPTSDQTIFYIMNCSDQIMANAFYGAEAMDIEIHLTVWAVNSPGPKNNMVLRKYEVFNKGNIDLDSCYFGMWSDPDVGNAGDDYVGCDTSLNLGYAYNAFPTDAVYGETPPACGSLLLQGPVTKGGINDTSKAFGEKKVGYKNLGMTAFPYYVSQNNDCFGGDYDWDGYFNRVYLYLYFQGNHRCQLQPFIIPNSEGDSIGVTRFPLSGNPVNGRGYVDGIIYQPADRRYILPSGPFDFKAGDKQEFIVAQIAAGAVEGVSNLEAVSLLKYYSEEAIQFYNDDFDLVKPPDKPDLTATEYNKKIILNWSVNEEERFKTENFNKQSYLFQGYNLYQLKSPDSISTEKKLIKRFDVKDEITQIYDYEYEAKANSFKSIKKFTLPNEGILRHFIINKDYFTDEELINGREYYFGVSSFICKTAGKTHQGFMESDINVIKVIPQKTKAGIIFETDFNDKLDVEHIAGKGELNVNVSAFDLYKTTGCDYEIIFDVAENTKKWKLINQTKDNKVESGWYNLDSENSKIVYDGLLLNIFEKEGIKEIKFLGEELLLNLESSDSLKEIGFDKTLLIKFAKVITPDPYNPEFDLNDENVSFGYRYIFDPYNNADPRFKNFIKVSKKSFDFEEFIKNVPLSVWDLSDENNPRRLAVGLIEYNSENGMVDGKYWPGENTSEDLIIFDLDYSESPAQDLMNNYKDSDLPVLLKLRFNRNENISWTGDENMRIYSYTNVSSDDKFKFKSPEVIFDIDTAKNDVKEINVFPNPYYVQQDYEKSRNESFVTFNHLPQNVEIKIFNLAGQHIRTLRKNDSSQFMKWDLLNEHQYQVASGVYIAYINMPELGTTKILKLAVIQKQIIPYYY